MAIAVQDKSLFEDILFGAADDTRFFELSIDPPEVPVGDPSAPQRIYFEKIEPALHLRMIEQIRIGEKLRSSDPISLCATESCRKSLTHGANL